MRLRSLFLPHMEVLIHILLALIEDVQKRVFLPSLLVGALSRIHRKTQSNGEGREFYLSSLKPWFCRRTQETDNTEDLMGNSDHDI